MERDRVGCRQGRRVLRAEEIAFVAAARVGRLATVNAAGEPTVVPICFAVVPSQLPVVVSVLDEKPKRVTDAELARVRNIRQHPAVSLVVDRYEEDWSQLAFVQVRGVARIVLPGEAGHAEAISRLRAKYAQYRAMAIEARPVIVIEQLMGFSWRGDGKPFDTMG